MYEASMLLSSDRYVVTLTNSAAKFLKFIEQEINIDCLLMHQCQELPFVLSNLQQKAKFFPAVIVLNLEKEELENNYLQKKEFIYHEEEVKLISSELNCLEAEIEKAIGQFFNLSSPSKSQETPDNKEQNTIHSQQERLAEKLRERLGYLGVYYKRNPQNFLRNMPPGERQQFLDQLKSRYRKIVLSYFSQNNTLNNQIDEFVNIAFFSDVPVTKIVEIHMDLMDDFSKQLKLEGRNEELLLDYRLTLIDTIAHLCEMYRRSIPKES
ncbi:MAG: circadian clock protein KaiA [Okeania sp. SIO2H7]|nr:circadian clock protein KaiA [Okeania sp. SIO2H7]